MRLAVEGAKGPQTVEFIYTAGALVQKAQEALDAVSAISSYTMQNGDGKALILCTAAEQHVRGMLRKEYAIQEELRKMVDDVNLNESQKSRGLVESVEALRRHVKAQQEVIQNYQRSLAFYENADRSPINKKVEASPEPARKEPERKDTSLILAQEKEILAQQREIQARSKELQEMKDTWAPPERLQQLTKEVTRLRGIESMCEGSKQENEALTRRARNLDKEGEALRSMVEALGAQLLQAKQGLLDSVKIDGSIGGPLNMDQYNIVAEKMRRTLVEGNGMSMDSYRLQATLAERDDLAASVGELKDALNKFRHQANQDKELMSGRDKVIADLREQMTKFQELYEETVNEMQNEVQKSVTDASEIKAKLVEAHDTAMKEFQEYASDLEAASSAERRNMALQNKSILEEERAANQELRGQLRIAELCASDSQKEGAHNQSVYRDESERMREDLMQMAEKSAHQRVQIIELEKLLDQAQDEISKVHTAMQQAVNEASDRIDSEADHAHKALAQREAKHIAGMTELSKALHDTSDQLKEQVRQKSELSQHLSAQIQALRADLQQKNGAVGRLTDELQALNQRLTVSQSDEIMIRNDTQNFSSENAVLKAGLQEARSGLKLMEAEEISLREVCRNLESDNVKLHDELLVAHASVEGRVIKETKHEERMLTQQKHNEELLELLEQQQYTLLQNSKDLADYEKTLVQMAAELDHFRQVYLYRYLTN